MWATRSVVQAGVELWVTLPLKGYPLNPRRRHIHGPEFLRLLSLQGVVNFLRH